MAEASKARSSTKVGAAAKKESKPRATKKVAEAEEPKTKQIKRAEVVAETIPADAAPEGKIEVEELEEKTAKAGKRSAKATREVEEKQSKEERKAQKPEANPSKPATKPPRSRLDRAGKKYREAAKLVEKDKVYALAEALELSVKTSTTKFDSSVELHINLGVDPKQADQNVRGTVSLPAGTGKNARVAVFAEADDAAKAKAAGADIAGDDELVAALEKEQIDFDILIATPNMMSRLAKYARLLGPKGLMPNPKSGTVTTDVAKAVNEAKAGRVEFRVDSNGIIHCAIGKVSFGGDKLKQNADAVIGAIKSARPASVKGAYIKSTFVATTMGPAIKTDI